MYKFKKKAPKPEKAVNPLSKKGMKMAEEERLGFGSDSD